MINKNCIFISVNKPFIPLLRICLGSIAKNYPNHPDIVICHTDLSDKDIRSLGNITPIIILKNTINNEELGPIMKHLPNDTDPRVFYARLLIRKDELFHKYNSVLHLDADTIVRSSLDELFQKEEFFMCREAYEGSDQVFKDNSDPYLIAKLNELDLTPDIKAGNAGIFLSPQKYNNVTTYNELLEILLEFKEYIKWADQSILNIWLCDKNIPLSYDTTYNFQHRRVMNKGLDHELYQSKIIHYNGIPTLYRSLCMKLGIYLFNSKPGRATYRLIYAILQRFYQW